MAYDHVPVNGPPGDNLGDDSFNVTDGPAVGSDQVYLVDGDSGGAALMLVDGAWQIVGVHEFTICAVDDCDPLSKFGEKAGDTSGLRLSGLAERGTRHWLRSGSGARDLGAPARGAYRRRPCVATAKDAQDVGHPAGGISR